MTRTVRGILCGAALCAAACVLVACGSSDSDSGSGGGKSASLEIPKSGCGAVATPPAKDPDGVLASLPASTQAQYAGYTSPVNKNIWADFKPNHPPPYKVGVSFAQLSNETQSGIYNSIKKDLEADPDIKVTAVTTGDQLNIPQQIQQFNSLIAEKPDVLIIEPLTDAFGPSADKAGKLGIPTISVQGTTDSKYAINMAGNTYGSGAQAASVVMRQMGSKGNTMFVHGIASTTVDLDSYNAYKAGLKSCPNIKPAGEIAGAFVASTAKAETLKFLATHPGPVEGVVEVGGMAPGVISGFKQAGRPIPIVGDSAGMKASLGYWINNKDSYNGFGQGFPPKRYGSAIASVTKSVLAGRGLKVSDITNYYVPITDSNLSDWAQTSWNLNTPGVAEGPPQQYMSEKFLDTLFTKPAAK